MICPLTTSPLYLGSLTLMRSNTFLTRATSGLLSCMRLAEDRAPPQKHDAKKTVNTMLRTHPTAMRAMRASRTYRKTSLVAFILTPKTTYFCARSLHVNLVRVKCADAAAYGVGITFRLGAECRRSYPDVCRESYESTRNHDPREGQNEPSLEPTSVVFALCY